MSLALTRDKKGRFLPGYNGKAGKSSAHYVDMIRQECDEVRWNNIVRKAIVQAENGDRYARDWLAGYLAGKPDHAASMRDQRIHVIVEHIDRTGDLASAQLQPAETIDGVLVERVAVDMEAESE